MNYVISFEEISLKFITVGEQVLIHPILCMPMLSFCVGCFFFLPSLGPFNYVCLDLSLDTSLEASLSVAFLFKSICRVIFKLH